MKSKTIVLTGCTRGLGRALVEYFVAAGHMVFGCGRSRDGVAALGEAVGAGGDFSVVDVADGAAVGAWACEVLERGSAPDLLINNAGVMARSAPMWELPPEEFDHVIDVNVKGTANVLRHFVPAMAQRNLGVIVNLSSGWGRSTAPDAAAYCASKWAVEGLTQALAQEIPDGMAAVALDPGIIHTDMLRECFGEEAADYPSPAEWVQRAGPFLLGLTARENGLAATVPGGPAD